MGGVECMCCQRTLFESHYRYQRCSMGLALASVAVMFSPRELHPFIVRVVFRVSLQVLYVRIWLEQLLLRAAGRQPHVAIRVGTCCRCRVDRQCSHADKGRACYVDSHIGADCSHVVESWNKAPSDTIQ